MDSAHGRYVIVFNGEIYNFLELRAALEAQGMSFRGHSDTEVMLAAFERVGVIEATQQFAGMFAFALFDKTERRLYLGRDRIGEKPLYYGWVGNVLLFGSELKALRAHPAWRSRGGAGINRGALSLLLQYGYIPGPHTIYEGINKLPPGTIAAFAEGRLLEIQRYWSAADKAADADTDRAAVNEEDLANELDGLLRDVVKREMISDVPLGAFLSGGIDSSLVVALMQSQSSRPVRTFTIGFHEQEYNEANHAKAVAHHLGTDHTELYVTPEEALAVVPKLPTLYDEPLGDCSQIPTFLVSALARRYVTVSLSGDGGDELFGGYDRYTRGLRIWRRLAPIPRIARRGFARVLRAVRPERWDAVLRWGGASISRRLGVRITGDRLHKLAEVVASDSAVTMYRDLLTHWQNATSVVRDSHNLDTALGHLDSTDVRDRSGHALLGVMMALDLVTYLPDDVLVKVDRASMAVSLESRAPFLEHRVAEFARRVPPDMKVKNGRGKWLLRRLLARYVPSSLVDRPKMGFGVPIDHWLRGPLKEWAASLLDAARLKREGYLDPAPIQQKWNEHQDGSRNWQYLLWDVLMFQAWLETQ